MIGQKMLLEYIDNLKNNFPRFSIIVGSQGSGKKTLVKEISKMLNVPYIIWENKIDDIRSLNELMNQQTETTIYCIPNYEDMTFRARNSLLKMCEEPPNKSYIILTSTSKEIILPTILNRGVVFVMQPYLEDELHCIEKDKYGFDMGHTREQVDKFITLCRVPGDLDKVRNMDFNAFVEFMKKFWEHIGSSSAGNSLKVASKLKIKEDSADTTLYDIDIFLNYLIKLNMQEEITEKQSKIYQLIMWARKCLQLKYNKQYIVDKFILDLRGIKNGVI